MPGAAVKGGEVSAVDANWEGTSGLESLFLVRLNGGWPEAAEIVVCSVLVAHDEADVVGGSNWLAGKVFDLEGGSDWLTGTWGGAGESDALGEGGVGEDGELRPVTSTGWCWHWVLRLSPSYPLVEGATNSHLV